VKSEKLWISFDGHVHAAQNRREFWATFRIAMQILCSKDRDEIIRQGLDLTYFEWCRSNPTQTVSIFLNELTEKSG
jgi:hypothetical protein